MAKSRAATAPTLYLRWSRANRAWFAMFGDAPCGIGPRERRIFTTLQDFNDYCRETDTLLWAQGVGSSTYAPICTRS